MTKIHTRVANLRVLVEYTDSGRWFWQVSDKPVNGRIDSGTDVNLADALHAAIVRATYANLFPTPLS